jgi:hypothetical protein
MTKLEEELVEKEKHRLAYLKASKKEAERRKRREKSEEHDYEE